MTDEQPKPWVHGSDDDVVACIAHARHDGKRVTREADQLIAQAAAARVLDAMRRAYVITPKAPQPLARADQLPKMGGGSMKAAIVRAFLDAADDLLAAQQRLMSRPLPEELRALMGAMWRRG
jgi:uncharacterized protein (DUF1778 family)